HPAYPLKTYEMFEHDPMNVVLAAFAKLAKHGEGAAVQFVVASEGERYNQHYKKIIRSLEKGKTIYKALHTPETVLGEVVKEVVEGVFNFEGSDKQDQNKMMRQNDQV